MARNKYKEVSLRGNIDIVPWSIQNPEKSPQALNWSILQRWHDMRAHIADIKLKFTHTFVVSSKAQSIWAGISPTNSTLLILWQTLSIGLSEHSWEASCYTERDRGEQMMSVNRALRWHQTRLISESQFSIICLLTPKQAFSHKRFPISGQHTLSLHCNGIRAITRPPLELRDTHFNPPLLYLQPIFRKQKKT